MRKNWKRHMVQERAWHLHFKRYYVVAPSGNIYFFYKGAYARTLYVACTLKALTDDDKEDFTKTGDLKPFYYLDGERLLTRAMAFVYETEENGGFPEQKKMNKYLSESREFNRLFALDKDISYDSMPA